MNSKDNEQFNILLSKSMDTRMEEGNIISHN